jgi:hypothetical protein
MLDRLLASSLALVLTIAGVPLCVGMDMSARARVGHLCSDEGTNPGAAGDAARYGTSDSDLDCCVLGSAPSPRAPADRVQVNTTGQWLPAPKGLTGGTAVSVRDPIPLSSVDPPGSPSFALHLFLCVFLI